MVMATVVKGLCQGCGICTQVCPRGAIRIIANVAVIDGDMCDDCEECVFACPNGSISG
ncbi:MAG: 4Fe-4S binding protein [Peptococcaceae bacterium]|nr:4Fe-4S binding protein [Peptococcaceae bacterium]